MKPWFYFPLFLFYQIEPSLQRCSSTAAITECEGVTFSQGQPIKLDPYRNFLQFKRIANSQEIPAGTFRLLPEVTTLYLSFNTIKKIDKESFQGLSKLKKLILSHNSLDNIPNFAFGELQQLVHLDLGSNQIKTIENDGFSSLLNLEELILSFNKLEIVPDLKHLAKLKIIDLSNNKIKSVDSFAFRGVGNLEILNLESNKIQFIADDAFSGLTKLKEVNVKDNYLSNLNATSVINNLKSLKTIKLSINDFVCTTLRAVVREFESRNIKVAQGLSKSNVTVNGIACTQQ